MGILYYVKANIWSWKKVLSNMLKDIDGNNNTMCYTPYHLTFQMVRLTYFD